ncbi:PREDICTED: uncharacterized protein LOC109464496 [Branchiostoma belcheri]|uniref:Uncharacterized protein LOC109464496 n=1 Tax=Branchiostoma belcheri TaxID=7741 RepID=A0A6P4XKI4_BRABE|nr:PREDICTED: uncharacterized protein LOC109464496 [Branchiostoma belcheri]XP_019617071.1 PREDICTED: uncharacterized protein LOC109464496 [Branchiostoma belcheri]XP_019617077.1 PREDICTED: uncharacterized protein LOC109464496 [Branchiostoma belcheri]
MASFGLVLALLLVVVTSSFSAPVPAKSEDKKGTGISAEVEKMREIQYAPTVNEDECYEDPKGNIHFQGIKCWDPSWAMLSDPLCVRTWEDDRCCPTVLCA